MFTRPDPNPARSPILLNFMMVSSPVEMTAEMCSASGKPKNPEGTPGPPLVNHKLVRPTEEDFGGQVPTQFAAEWALDGYGLERKFIPA